METQIGKIIPMILQQKLIQQMHFYVKLGIMMIFIRWKKLSLSFLTYTWV